MRTTKVLESYFSFLFLLGFFASSIFSEPWIVRSNNIQFLNDLNEDYNEEIVSKCKFAYIKLELEGTKAIGDLANRILDARPVGAKVSMFREVDQNELLRHLVFGIENSEVQSLIKSTKPKLHSLFHIHGHFNYDNSDPGNKTINQAVQDLGVSIKKHLQEKGYLTYWGSTPNGSIHANSSDGPHLVGSWAAYLKPDGQSLGEAIVFLLENNVHKKAPYLIHALSSSDANNDALRDHFHSVITFGAFKVSEGGVDWATQYDLNWVRHYWM